MTVCFHLTSINTLFLKSFLLSSIQILFLFSVQFFFLPANSNWISILSESRLFVKNWVGSHDITKSESKVFFFFALFFVRYSFPKIKLFQFRVHRVASGYNRIEFIQRKSFSSCSSIEKSFMRSVKMCFLVIFTWARYKHLKYI